MVPGYILPQNQVTLTFLPGKEEGWRGGGGGERRMKVTRFPADLLRNRCFLLQTGAALPAWRKRQGGEGEGGRGEREGERSSSTSPVSYKCVKVITPLYMYL